MVAVVSGKTAIEIVNTLIVKKYISSLQHAADMGIELCKAELALKYKLNYIQDKNLKTPTEIAQDKELKKFIDKIINSSLLSKMQGKYVRLRFLKGLTVREIAEISGKSRQGVGESLKKAILKIQHSDFQYEYKTRFC